MADTIPGLDINWQAGAPKSILDLVNNAFAKGVTKEGIGQLLVALAQGELDQAGVKRCLMIAANEPHESINSIINDNISSRWHDSAQQDEMNIKGFNHIVALAEQVITNERGGKQHAIPVAYDCLDTFAMQCLGEVLAYGKQEYGADNWRNIDVLDHINHAIAHLINAISLCKTEHMFDGAQEVTQFYEDQKRDTISNHTKLIEELTHAFARNMFALGVSK